MKSSNPGMFGNIHMRFKGDNEIEQGALVVLALYIQYSCKSSGHSINILVIVSIWTYYTCYVQPDCVSVI